MELKNLWFLIIMSFFSVFILAKIISFYYIIHPTTFNEIIFDFLSFFLFIFYISITILVIAINIYQYYKEKKNKKNETGKNTSPRRNINKSI